MFIPVRPDSSPKVPQTESSTVEQESAAVGVETPWETVHVSVASLPEQAAKLRRQLREFLSSSALSSEELADVEIAVGEAFANALKHGSPRGELDEVLIKCRRNERTVVVEVHDNGCGFDADSVLSVAPNRPREGGMGIFLMKALMDSVEFEFGTGTTVRLVKHCRQNPPKS